MSGFSLICCVVNMGDAEKTLDCAKKYGVKGGTIIIGRGTVRSHLLDILGLNEVRKEVVKMVVETELATAAIKGIGKEMNFYKPNHGIIFSMSVLEFIGSRNKVEGTSETGEVENKMYKVIYVIVDRGNADNVIDAANSAGARGATIINARGAGIHEIQTFFKMKIVPEKEEVFIIIPAELKDGIVEAIRTQAKIDEPGNGILFVMDVNEAYGLQ